MISKTCDRCLSEKMLTEFYKSSKRKDGYLPYCKTCEKSRVNSYYESNKKQLYETRKKYREENKIKSSDWSKKHYSLNKEKIRQTQKAYYEKNKAVFSQKCALRYARKTQQTPAWLNKGHVAEMEGFYTFCQIFKGFEVDHIVPIKGKTVSGLHAPWNLQILTEEQNRAKSNNF